MEKSYIRMEKRQFRIKANEMVAQATYRIELEACTPGYEFSGEFVDIALEGFFLRRPFSVLDTIPGGMSLLYKVVGKGTEKLAQMFEGEILDVLTGLGRSFDADRCSGKALLVAGGLGAAPMYMLCKKLRGQGKEVTVILGFNRREDVVLMSEYGKICPGKVHLVTLDGSLGMKGMVTDVIDALKPEYDFFYTCGPMVMMRAVCEKLEGQGQLNLEERMGCGIGTCYGCSCQTVVGAKRICKDGPVFDKEEIIW